VGILDRAYNIDDLAKIAKRRLPTGLYEFIDRGAEDEITVRENEESIKRTLFRQRVGVDVTTRDTSTAVFGVKQSMPIGVGVTGLVGMLSYQGEYRIARAAAAAGVPYTLGNSNFASLAKVKEICGDLLWRQLYPLQQQIMDHQIAVAKEVGVKVLVITMDSPVNGNREYMWRSGFMQRTINSTAMRQMLMAPHWLFTTILPYMLRGGLPQVPDMPEGHRIFFGKRKTLASMPVASFDWECLKALRRGWQDVLVVKGISTVEDAMIASSCGVDGIIVSNHGGRSLDGCVPSFGALAPIVDAVAPKVTVMVDGGFKRGADVLKAIAAGASCVMVGRATTFGLAAGGEQGVTKALEILGMETSRALAMLGCTRIDQLSRDLLQFPH